MLVNVAIYRVKKGVKCNTKTQKNALYNIFIKIN